MKETLEETRPDVGLHIQHALEEAISAAVATARKQAADHSFLGNPIRRQGDHYYPMVALHRLFLLACGADVVDQTGGDVKKASRILYMGGTIAQAWQKENKNFRTVKVPNTPGFAEEELRDRMELRQSAEQLVRDEVTKALVEHVSKHDTEFKARVRLAVEARIPKDDSGSQQGEMFSEFVRAAAGRLLNEPKRTLDSAPEGGSD